MKKFSILLAIAVIALFMAACSQTAEPVKSNAEAESAKPDEKEKEVAEDTTNSEMTLQELFAKTIEVNEEIQSFATDIDMTQVMDIGGETMNMDSKMQMKFITDPVALEQNMDYTIDMGADGKESMVSEAYLTEDGFFMYEPMQKVWLKMPTEFSDQILNMQNAQTNPAEQIEDLKAFAEDFKFEQNDKEYILTLSAAGEKFNDFLKETMKENLPQDMQMGDEIFNSMKFNQVDYEIHIDKETFYPTVLNMVMDTETKVENQTMKIKQTVKADYYDYNKIKEIKVPEEALKSAQEINLNDMNNGE